MLKKRMLILMLLMFSCLTGALAEGREIALDTAVTKWGQMPQRFEIRGQALPEGVTAADFAITGAASSWEGPVLHPFTCTVEEVAATEDGWALVPGLFPDKYFYVQELEVTCAAHPELSFTMADIAETRTAVADEFGSVEDEESRFTARVFVPEHEGPLPVVIVFHGYGDTANLLSYRTAVAWAEPESQAVRPCIVIAPTIINTYYTSDIARQKIFVGLMRYVDELVAAGKADPARVYALGNSFGGMAAFDLAGLYPERIAAVLALCPALNYSKRAMESLLTMADIPVTIAQAENDETIPVMVGRGAAEMLTNAGNPNVRLRIYSDEEMNAAGARFGQEQTYSFHHVELAVMEDEVYAEWLFQQVKE